MKSIMNYMVIMKNKRNYRHVKASEGACNCGCGHNLDHRLYVFLDEIRDEYGQPIRITGPARCITRNAEVGGVPTSQHVSGMACDITGGDLVTLVDILKRHSDEIFQLIYYKSKRFVHIGLKDKGKLGFTYSIRE